MVSGLQEKKVINLVWLKRDLRSTDHIPLYVAEQDAVPYLIVYLFEPSLIHYADTSLRHLQFQYHSLLALDKKLEKYNRRVVLFYADAVEAFVEISSYYTINHIFSYQESGPQITYDRDKAVAAFCTQHNIIWKEFQRDGIIRGIKNREQWDKKWYVTMSNPIIQNQFTTNTLPPFEPQRKIPDDLVRALENYPVAYQPAGEENALRYLDSFINERSINYTRHISKPEESRKSCTRLSPYLSWGNLSVKQVYQVLDQAAKFSPYKQPIKNAIMRLKWRCHFIQKFEVDCSYEYKCINEGFELLEHPRNDVYIEAWKSGKTGYPLIDACMQCLIQTGWINFRMRAMLVSFFCHHLYQDWRYGAQYMASLFLDYEPGIHYPQFQMQAGTTGINTIRIYNPIKQSTDHDPHGHFIKKWIPALQDVPENFIHEPYAMSLMDQQLCKVIIGVDYPQPIIDITEAGKQARQKIWGHKKHPAVGSQKFRILQRHTRQSKGRLSGSA
jgi:deoxyribodipyrimidine photo-lyase